MEARPGKVPRAFCAPIRVPDRVVLVVLPQGGQEDYAALFHEAGHTEHFGTRARTLPAEERVLGDNAVTEGFAFLLEHLTGDARWLAARLDMPPKRPVRALLAPSSRCSSCAATAPSWRTSWSCTRGAPLESLPEPLRAAPVERRRRPLSRVGLPRGRRRRLLLHVLPAGLGVRGAAFATGCASATDSNWFAQREAGFLVRELWELGQSLDADALLREVTGQSIDFGVLSDRARDALS